MNSTIFWLFYRILTLLNKNAVSSCTSSWKTSEYIRIQRNTREYIKIYWYPSEYIQIHQYLPLSSWMGIDGLIYTHLCPSMPIQPNNGDINVFWCILLYSEVFKCILMNSTIFWLFYRILTHLCPSMPIQHNNGIYQCILMYSDVFRCIMMYSDVF